MWWCAVRLGECRSVRVRLTKSVLQTTEPGYQLIPVGVCLPYHINLKVYVGIDVFIKTIPAGVRSRMENGWRSVQFPAYINLHTDNGLHRAGISLTMTVSCCYSYEASQKRQQNATLTREPQSLYHTRGEIVQFLDFHSSRSSFLALMPYAW